MESYQKTRISSIVGVLVKLDELDKAAEEIQEQKKRLLAGAGWKAGSPYDFLGMSDEEVEEVESRLRLFNEQRSER